MHSKIIQKLILIFLLMSFCSYYFFRDEVYSGNSQHISTSVIFILSIFGIIYLLYSMTHNALQDARQSSELLALEQQKKLKAEQNQALASRRQQTHSLQQNMEQGLHTYESLMNEHRYEEASSCLEALISHFQEERFHPICSDNLIVFWQNKKPVRFKF